MAPKPMLCGKMVAPRTLLWPDRSSQMMNTQATGEVSSRAAVIWRSEHSSGVAARLPLDGYRH